MGIMRFNLPPNLPSEVTAALERASVAGGGDGMPLLSRAQVESGQLRVARDTSESGSLRTPWSVKDLGQLMYTTATLVESASPYNLVMELARGKVNQLRNQTAEWLMAGLTLSDELAEQIRRATQAFSRAVGSIPSEDAARQAETALSLASLASEELIRTYTNQVFQYRLRNQTQLQTLLGCRVGPVIPEGDAAAALIHCSNIISLSFLIGDVCPADGDFCWEAHDRSVEWALGEGLVVHGGPLIDFSPARIPSWLWLWQSDRSRIAKHLCEYAVEVIDRYPDIVTWEVAAAANLPGSLSLTDDELLWVTLQVVDSARRAAPHCEIILGLAQPWGDYLAQEERVYSPLTFVDTLLRSGVSLAAIDLEVVMGTTPRGSYCRDLLEFSRMLDLYAFLGVPLHVTLGYPAGTELDGAADSEADVNAGWWRSGIDPQVQANWAEEYVSLALCKPHVRTVLWTNLLDAQPHPFPNCGLIDAANKARPAAGRLRKLRERYLR